VLDHGYEQVVLRIVPGSNPLRVVNPPGQRTPALITSNGRAMLARLSDEDVRARVPTPYPKLPRNSPQDFTQLMARLDEIRRSGVSEAADEAIEGVASQGFALASGETGELIGIAVSYSVQATTAAERANVRRELGTLAQRLRHMTSDPSGQIATPLRAGTRSR
jgi:DNA-binding IclR family transcriptional regulator